MKILFKKLCWFSSVFIALSVFCFSTIVVSNEITARALIIADKQVLISSQTQGRIDRISFKEGESFNKNQVLIDFDCREKRAELNYSEESLRGAQKQSEAQKQLSSLDTGSRLDYEMAIIEAKKVKFTRDMARIRLGYCKIIAPFSGKVVSRHVDAYEYVNRGDPLLEIINNKELRARILIPVRILSLIRKGLIFFLTIDETSKTYKAEIERIGVAVDGISQMIPIYAKIQKSDTLLLPGMAGIAVFNYPQE